MASAKIRLGRSDGPGELGVGVGNRSCSKRVRPNARITRTPVICSRITWLMRSTLTCMERNSGSSRTSMHADDQGHDRHGDHQQQGQRGAPP